MTPDPTVATATRQAAALLVHFARADHEGFNAVVSEVSTGEQMRDLLLGVLGLFATVLPALMTPAGVGLVERMIADLARIEVGGPS